jgi:hypothetical protein
MAEERKTIDGKVKATKLNVAEIVRNSQEITETEIAFRH